MTPIVPRGFQSELHGFAGGTLLGALAFWGGHKDGKHLWVMLKLSWLFLDDHLQQRANTSGSDVLLLFFSKLQSEIWRITNKEGKEAREHADRARAPAEVPSLDHRSGDACSIQLEPSAGAAWSVHRTGGFEKYGVSFPRISWFKMFKTSFFQCFLWPLHVMGWIHRVLDTPTKKQTTWTNSNFCRGAVSRERNSPGFRAPGAGRTPGNN